MFSMPFAYASISTVFQRGHNREPCFFAEDAT
jgi:hypothetical protein